MFASTECSGESALGSYTSVVARPFTAFPIKMVLTFYRTLHKITSFIHVYNLHMFMKTVEKNINPCSALVSSLYN